MSKKRPLTAQDLQDLLNSRLEGIDFNTLFDTTFLTPQDWNAPIAPAGGTGNGGGGLAIDGLFPLADEVVSTRLGINAPRNDGSNEDSGQDTGSASGNGASFLGLGGAGPRIVNVDDGANDLPTGASASLSAWHGLFVNGNGSSGIGANGNAAPAGDSPTLAVCHDGPSPDSSGTNAATGSAQPALGLGNGFGVVDAQAPTPPLMTSCGIAPAADTPPTWSLGQPASAEFGGLARCGGWVPTTPEAHVDRFWEFGPPETEEFVVTGGRWTDNGTSSGSFSSSLGASGGVVAWSIAGAGLDDASNQLYGGTSVSLGSFLSFDYTAVLRSAFDAWAQIANIEFVQVADQGGSIASATFPTIRVSGAFMDGDSNVLAAAFFPHPSAAGGDMCFDSGEVGFWDAQSFFLVAAHEIGHALGLNHEQVELALMNPFYNPSLTGLQQDDIDGMQAVYGTQDFGPNVYYMPASQANMTIFDSPSTFTVNGNALNNVITGSSAAETINGLGGNDTINGGGGADTMTGGIGDDTYTIDTLSDVINENGGEGTDTVNTLVDGYTLGTNIEHGTIGVGTGLTLTGNSLNNNLTGNAGGDTLNGAGGNDTLNGLGGADTMAGGLGDDQYFVDNASDAANESTGEGHDTVWASVSYTLANGSEIEDLALLAAGGAINGTGNSGNNNIFGNASNNTLNGAAGNDILNGGGGTDTFIGGDGNDQFIVDSTADAITENAGEGFDSVFSSATYTLSNNVEDLALTGTSNINGTGNGGNNNIFGNSGNNTLTGGAGNDIIQGGGGQDTLRGGLGDDQMVVDSTNDSATENSGEGLDTVWSSVNWTLGNNIENLGLTGTALNGTGNSLNNVLVGNAQNNTLNGGAGNDTLLGGVGTDTMIGGTGDDVFVVDNAGDVITESSGQGTDTAFSTVSYTIGANVETLVLQSGAGAIDGTGNSGNNALHGNASANVLTGLAGDDLLVGNGGIDTFVGGQGNDTYDVDNTGETVTELSGEGIDGVFTSATFTLSANIENLVLKAGAGAIDGTGNALANVLIGNEGANVLNGAGGIDNITGDLGNDTFVFAAGESNGDILNDFLGNGAAAGDMFQFTGYGTAAAGATFVQVDATHWQVNSADGTIHDVITIANGATIDASDYLFV